MTASLSSAMDSGVKAAVVKDVQLGSWVRVGFRVRVTDLDEQTHTHTNM